MRLCMHHSDDLLTALKHKGMGALIDSDPQSVALKTKLWLEGKASRQEIDAYVVSVLEINDKARSYCGRGDFCPLCQTSRLLRQQDLPRAWIDNCTDAVLLICKTNELC